MCLLGNSSYCEASNADFNDAIEEGPRSRLGKYFLESDWISGPGGGAPSIEAAWPARFCKYHIMGHGKSFNIDPLNVRLSVMLLPDCNPLSTDTSQKIWTVDITSIANSSPEAAHCASEAQYIFLWLISFFSGLCGCCCFVKKVHAERMETHGDHECFACDCCLY